MALLSKEIHSFCKGNSTPVLIVGAGPAGFIAAATLSRYGIPLPIIDKHLNPIQRGQQADYSLEQQRYSIRSDYSTSLQSTATK